MTRAVLYPRVSTGKQAGDDATSLENQEARCREHAAAREYGVVGLYREVHTGVELWERPQLMRLLEAAARREFDVVVVYHSWRWGRDPEQRIYLKVELARYGVRVEYVLDPTPEGEHADLIEYVNGWAGKKEWRAIQQRAVDGRRDRALLKQALVPGPRPPYGYAWRDPARRALIEDLATGPVVRRVFKEYVAGRTQRAIAAGLTVDGIPTPAPHRAKERNRGTWGRTSIAKILADRRYTGDAVAFHTSGREAPIPLPPGTIPVLVGAEDFAFAGARITANQLGSPRRVKNAEDFLLRAGHIRCRDCDMAMAAYNRADGRKAYRCPRCNLTPPAGRVDALVWDSLYSFLLDEDALAREVERLLGDDPSKDTLRHIDAQLVQLAAVRENFSKLVAEAGSDAAITELARDLEAIVAKKQALVEERTRVAARRAEWEAARTGLDLFATWLERVVQTADFGLDYTRKRGILAYLGLVTEVSKGEPRKPCRVTWSVRVLPGESTTRLVAGWAQADAEQAGGESSTLATSPRISGSGRRRERSR